MLCGFFIIFQLQQARSGLVNMSSTFIDILALLPYRCSAAAFIAAVKTQPALMYDAHSLQNCDSNSTLLCYYFTSPATESNFISNSPGERLHRSGIQVQNIDIIWNKTQRKARRRGSGRMRAISELWLAARLRKKLRIFLVAWKIYIYCIWMGCWVYAIRCLSGNCQNYVFSCRRCKGLAFQMLPGYFIEVVKKRI